MRYIFSGSSINSYHGGINPLPHGSMLRLLTQATSVENYLQIIHIEPLRESGTCGTFVGRDFTIFLHASCPKPDAQQKYV